MLEQALWISVSPTLKKFHRPLLNCLSPQLAIREWKYQQAADEPSTFDLPLTLLHDYLKYWDRPIHLLGHSTGGIVALLYAYRYPERVQSLTLLGVGVHPLIDWHAHYYAYRQLLPCSRGIVLGQMVRALFGQQNPMRTKEFVKRLEGDLQATPSPHSLIQRHRMEPQGVESPLFLCGSNDDVIIDPSALNQWNDYLKPEDRIWECSQGHHFFHYHHPQTTANAILNFYREVGASPCSIEKSYRVDS